MLTPFIIEQIRRREEAERRKSEADRPRLEISIESPWPDSEHPSTDDESGRGVVVVDL